MRACLGLVTASCVALVALLCPHVAPAQTRPPVTAADRVDPIAGMSRGSAAVAGWAIGGGVHPDNVEMNIKRYKLTELANFTEYDVHTCAQLPSHWELNTLPKYGTYELHSLPCTLSSGICSGTTLTCEHISYTWKAENNISTSEVFEATWKATVNNINEIFLLHVKIQLPEGEQTKIVGFDSVTLLGKFVIHLTPPANAPNFDFSNSEVQERDPGGGLDTCWFKKSAFAPTISVSGNGPGMNWIVTKKNNFKFDYVGWNQDAVLYYRQQKLLHPNHTMPCGTVIPQQMTILAPVGEGGFIKYGPINVLQDDMTMTSRTSTRNGVSSTLPQ